MGVVQVVLSKVCSFDLPAPHHPSDLCAPHHASHQVRMAQLDTAPVADIVEFVYVNAPRPASGLIPQDVVSVFEGPYYEYWNANKDAHGVWHYDGLRETIMFFDDYLRMHGPFDGVMGFSQGGAMASLLIALQEAGLLHRVCCRDVCMWVYPHSRCTHAHQNRISPAFAFAWCLLASGYVTKN